MGVSGGALLAVRCSRERFCREVSRPVIPKDPSEQLTLLSRMLRQVDVDGRYKPRRRKVIKAKITSLMTEFAKEVNGHDEAREA